MRTLIVTLLSIVIAVSAVHDIQDISQPEPTFRVAMSRHKDKQILFVNHHSPSRPRLPASTTMEFLKSQNMVHEGNEVTWHKSADGIGYHLINDVVPVATFNTKTELIAATGCDCQCREGDQLASCSSCWNTCLERFKDVAVDIPPATEAPPLLGVSANCLGCVCGTFDLYCIYNCLECCREYRC